MSRVYLVTRNEIQEDGQVVDYVDCGLDTTTLNTMPLPFAPLEEYPFQDDGDGPYIELDEN